MLMQAATSDDAAPDPLRELKVDTKHGTTVAEALAFVKKARRIYAAVQFAGPQPQRDYFSISKREAVSKLASLKPDKRLTSLCKDYTHRENAKWVTVWLGSTYSDEPAETAVSS